MYRWIPGLQPIPNSPRIRAPSSRSSFDEQHLLVRPRRGLDDLAAFVAHPDALDEVGLLVGGVLEEADDPLGRLLDRAVEDLAAGHVGVAVVDSPFRPSRLKLRSVSAPTMRTSLAAVEAVGDPLHLLALGVPVEQDGAVQEVLEAGQAHARPPGRARGRGSGR